jgi:Ni,Fe-hydrogenase I large subunit
MTGLIKVGSQEIPVVSNAATGFIFKSCFHEDLLTFLAGDKPDEGLMTEMLLKAFYIMAKQAEISEMSVLLKSGLNYDSFIEYISKFEILDSGSIATQVYNVWCGNADTGETAENSEAPEDSKKSKKKAASTTAK